MFQAWQAGALSDIAVLVVILSDIDAHSSDRYALAAHLD
jgi:hypothetical protein